MRFFKMNGLGNDYIFIERSQVPKTNSLSNLVKILCDVHTGIGGDGVVLFGNGYSTDLIMHIYNRDGTEAEMCGNALRCLIRHYNAINKEVTVLTLSGIKAGIYDGEEITINLSKPVSVDTDYYEIPYMGKVIKGKRVNVGNPHFIINDKYDEKIAEYVSNNTEFFPNKTNVEFYYEKEGELFVRVYERGCGETMACGTGAAAVLCASEMKSAKIHLLGGTLQCFYNQKGEILQKGKASYNYQGEWKNVYDQ